MKKIIVALSVLLLSVSPIFAGEYTSDDSTVLLLHLNSNFIDASSYVGINTPTITGTIIDNAIYKFGTGSASLDGIDDNVEYPNSENYHFSTERFTIDFWVYFNDVVSPQFLLGQYFDSLHWWAFDLNDTTIGGAGFRFYDSGYLLRIYNTYTFNIHQWYHFALIRGWENNNDSFALTVNGTVIATDSISVNFPNTEGTIALNSYFSSVFLDGKEDEVRISKGIARWTSNFDPDPATPTPTPPNPVKQYLPIKESLTVKQSLPVKQYLPMK
jgi:hypothetical protein